MAVTLTNTPARISSASATSHSPSLGFTPTAGRLLVVGWNAAGGTVTYSNVDPDWTLIHDNTNAGRVHSCGWAYRISDGTETNFSVDVSSSQALVFMFLELDGLAGSSVLDQAAESTANQNSTNATSASTGTTATLSVSDGYALQFYSCDGQQGWDTGRTFTNGSTELANNFNGGGTSSPGMIFAYKVLSSTTGFSETISTTDAGDGMYGSVAVFKQAASGATDLTVSEASHGHTADSLTLSVGVSLAINDATHGHAADAVALTTASTLAVADATHAHAADQVTLTLAGSESLTIADATHAHTADALVLSVDSLLAVADALHAHSADNVVLGVTGVADLIIADATHAHSVDGLVLTAQSLLAIQDALHAHAADALTLNSAPTLLIAEALHAHTSDGLALTVDAWLVIADARHAHAADVVALTVAGGDLSASPGYTITGRLRAFEVRGRSRRFEVDQ